MPIIYVQESELRRNLSSLKRELKSLLELALVYKWQLKEINDRLEGVVMRRKKRKYTRKLVQKENVSQSAVCSLCNDRGSIDLDKIGLVTKFCTCEAGKRLRERVRETGGIR
jgi:hypothetical protein